MNETIYKALDFDGTLNERVYKYLGGLGYEGSLSDRLAKLEVGGKKGWQALIEHSLSPSPSPEPNPNLFTDTNLASSYWAKTTTSVSEAPEGGYELTATGTFPRLARVLYLQPDEAYTASIYVKAGSAYHVTVAPYDKQGNSFSCRFDLDAGIITQEPEGTTCHMEEVGDGWWRLGTTFQGGTGEADNEIRIISHGQGLTGGWSGSDSTIYAQMPKLEIGESPTGSLTF